MSSDQPGPLIGTGRSADVFAIGRDRVLRRFRTDHDVRTEAAVMTHLAASGFPVPRVHDADGRDLVLDRLDGTDMLAGLSRRPWLAGRYGRLLADLHNRLHRIEAPAGLRPLLGPGNRVLHLDLHPANVMLTERGPYVIDWTNAAAGAPGADVAMAYVIMATSDTDLLPARLQPAIGVMRSIALRQFLKTVRDDPAPHLAAAARERLLDRNIRPAEARRLRQIIERAEAAASGGD